MTTSVSERSDPASQEQPPNTTTPHIATKTEDIQLTMDERIRHRSVPMQPNDQSVDELLSKDFGNKARITDTGTHVVLDGNVSTGNNLTDGVNSF